MAETPNQPGSRPLAHPSPRQSKQHEWQASGEATTGKPDDTNRARPGTNGSKDTIQEMLDRLQQSGANIGRVQSRSCATRRNHPPPRD